MAVASDNVLCMCYLLAKYLISYIYIGLPHNLSLNVNAALASLNPAPAAAVSLITNTMACFAAFYVDSTFKMHNILRKQPF